MTSAAASVPPGARQEQVSAAPSCTHQASACYLLGVVGRGVDRTKQREGPSLPSKDSSKYIDKSIQGQKILVLDGGTSHAETYLGLDWEVGQGTWHLGQDEGFEEEFLK